MQAIAPVTADQLLAPGQVPKAKVEIYNNASWINLGNLFSPIDLVGWWAFDEGAGMVAYDHSKYGNHGSLESMTEEDWVDGKVGKCLDFDGENDYVQVPNITPLDSDPWSFSHWIKWAGQDDEAFVFYAGSLSTNRSFLLRNNNNNRFAFRDKNGAYHSFASGSSTPYIGEWTHLTWVADGSGNLSLYVNGELLGTLTSVPTELLFQAIGRGYAGYYFEGLIDEVLIYNCALTEGEIKGLFELKGKNYVEGVSVSLGGASMTPNPVGGKVNAALLNKDSIFHPQHPTSAYKDYLKTGRKIRASIGATYNDTDYLWQRVIGVMDEPKFTAPDYKVSISGADYMKFLQDAELRIPKNYWGPYQTFDSIPSDGLMGDELYNEVDAMDINNEAPNVTNWPVTGACTFVSEADTGGGSIYVGKLISTSSSAYAKNLNVGTVEAGKEYKVSFKYRRFSGTGKLRVSILQDDGGEVELNFIDDLASFSYETASIYFTAAVSGAVRMKLMAWEVFPGERQFRIDQITLWRFIPYWERYYELPEACKGAYYVTLDKGAGAEPVWEGTGDEDWEYAEDAEPGPDPPAHPARIVYFNINKTVPKGTDNLVIHYFTVESPENAVARILYFAGLYENEATAKAAMEYTATEILIDRIWFKPGSKLLNAIKKLCEKCDYRFHFKWDGTPVFKPKPAPETTAFTFTSQKHIASFSNYQARNEIKNRIIIKGEKQAGPASREETMPPELKGEAYDQASIDEYGERTLTIDNHLFQDQASLNAMCDKLLAEYKDPKWYTDLEIPYRPVPLELGDKISWKERLSPVLEIAQEGIIRDIKIDNFNTIYVCEK